MRRPVLVTVVQMYWRMVSKHSSGRAAQFLLISLDRGCLMEFHLLCPRAHNK